MEINWWSWGGSIIFRDDFEKKIEILPRYYK